VLTWHLGKRNPAATREFAGKLRTATAGWFQLSTDGYIPYRNAVRQTFGNLLDFAQLVKVYGRAPEEGSAARYSPPEVVSVYSLVFTGQPDPDRVCTSHAERQNLSMRMTLRRLTRLTNGHSKKWANHGAALALYFAFYNFCRVHSTLKTTPAVKAKLADRTWTVAELLQNAA